MKNDPLNLLALNQDVPVPMIITAEGEYSRKCILRMAGRIAARLLDAGAGGSNVVLSLDAGPSFAAALVGCWFAGSTPVLLDPLVKNELGRAVVRTGARAVIRGSADSSGPGEDSVAVIVPDGDEDSRDWKAPPVPVDEPVLYLFTSGSTGLPNIVPKTFEQLHVEFRFLSGFLNSPRRGATLVPWCHILGFIVSFLVPIGVGGTCDLSAGISPRIVLERAGAGLLDLVVAVPSIYKIMNRLMERGQVKASAPGCTFITSGAPLQLAVRSAFEGHTQASVIDLYGSTEAGGVAYRDNDGPWLVQPHVEWRLDDGGQLMVRSGSVSLGETGEFFPMGDLVRREGEGFVLQGRADDVVKIGGRRLSLDEIVVVLEQCPGVERGMAAARPIRGELRIVAWVEASDKGLQSEDVKHFMRERMADHKVPRVIRFVDKMPITPAGKVDRKMLDGIGSERR